MRLALAASAAGESSAGEAEALFEADDAVLNLEVLDAAVGGNGEQGEGDQDDPELEQQRVRGGGGCVAM